ncbi:MAG: hypothetical protein ABEJ95_01260 [Candidatus Nanohalobium sp.]
MPLKNDLPEDAIVIKGDSKVFTQPVETSKNASLEQIKGSLKDYNEEYSSVELQHKASEWRRNVSD